MTQSFIHIMNIFDLSESIITDHIIDINSHHHTRLINNNICALNFCKTINYINTSEIDDDLLNNILCITRRHNVAFMCFNSENKYNNKKRNNKLINFYKLNNIYLEHLEGFCIGGAERGYTSLIKFAHKNSGVKYDMCCDISAEYGHLKCLMYAHTNGFPWSTKTCALASGYGHLECLKYAYENGCPWNEETCEFAYDYRWNSESKFFKYHNHKTYVNNKTLECIIYAYTHGCPCPAHIIQQYNLTQYIKLIKGNNEVSN